ncbi:MAG: ABC transporter permease [Actinomycetota bacterium]|nr:ABC transporter permease [Actinomycetota bacterium]
MTTVLFVRRFLADYGRNPVNVLLIIVVPVVFVVVAAGPMANFAKLGLFGSGGSGAAIQTATAGWAAGFLAAIAMYFQVCAARDTDRRLVISGLHAARLVTARLAAGLTLAVLASAAALAALAARAGGIADPGRVIAGTLMFAVIYLAIGALAGALVRSPLNGTLLILFVWIIDVFLGPAFGTAGTAATRVLPTHYVTLWMTGLQPGHARMPASLGWALAWTTGAAAAAWIVVTATSRTARTRHRRRPGTASDQLIAATRGGLLDWGRNRALWALLAVVPAVFILMTKVTTPARFVRIALTEHNRQVTMVVNLAVIHPAVMAPIAIASLSAIAAMFIMLDSRAGDERLVLAGQRPGPLLAARLSLIALAALVATAVSLAVTATVSDVRQWGIYIAANVLVAATYALIGVLIGPLLGRVAGVFIAFLIPFTDLGISQSPMLRATPAAWAHFLPGYGAGQIVMNGLLAPSFDQTSSLLIALAWLAGLATAATLMYRRPARTATARIGCPAPVRS